MMEFVYEYIFGWYGVTGLIVAACVAVFIIFPSLRPYAIAVAAGALALAGAVGHGRRQQAALEQRRKEEAVKKVNKDYDKIEKEERTVDHVKGRLKDGSF